MQGGRQLVARGQLGTDFPVVLSAGLADDVLATEFQFALVCGVKEVNLAGWLGVEVHRQVSFSPL